MLVPDRYHTGKVYILILSFFNIAHAQPIRFNTSERIRMLPVLDLDVICVYIAIGSRVLLDAAGDCSI